MEQKGNIDKTKKGSLREGEENNIKDKKEKKSDICIQDNNTFRIKKTPHQNQLYQPNEQLPQFKNQLQNMHCLLVYILSYGGGIVGGDHVNINCLLNENTNVCLASQGSTKVFKAKYCSWQLQRQK